MYEFPANVFLDVFQAAHFRSWSSGISHEAGIHPKGRRSWQQEILLIVLRSFTFQAPTTASTKLVFGILVISKGIFESRRIPKPQCMHHFNCPVCKFLLCVLLFHHWQHVVFIAPPWRREGEPAYGTTYCSVLIFLVPCMFPWSMYSIFCTNYEFYSWLHTCIYCVVRADTCIILDDIKGEVWFFCQDSFVWIELLQLRAM